MSAITFVTHDHRWIYYWQIILKLTFYYVLNTRDFASRQKRGSGTPDSGKNPGSVLAWYYILHLLCKYVKSV